MSGKDEGGRMRDEKLAPASRLNTKDAEISSLTTRPEGTHPSSLVLVGFMGSGKSSIGRRVARRLRCAFLDLDREVEVAAGKRIPQIFADEGEEAFRRREIQALRDALKKAVVVASGGGLVTRPENRAALREAVEQGTSIIYLKAEPSTLAERIRRQPGKRPLIDGPGKILDYEATKQRVEELLALRQELYQECATHTVVTDGRDFDSVVDEIVQACKTP